MSKPIIPMDTLSSGPCHALWSCESHPPRGEVQPSILSDDGQMSESTPTVITVQGSHSEWFAAERGTVQVSVAFDGADRAPVFEKATTVAAVVTAELGAMLDADAGPVTWWSSDQVRVWSERPWNQQ